MKQYNFELVFRDYKIRIIEQNKKYNPINILIKESVPLSGIITVLLFLIALMFLAAFSLTKNQFGTEVALFVALLIILVSYFWSTNHNNLEYIEFRKNVANTKTNILIAILKDYGISVYDEKSIDLLITEAEYAQKNSDYFSPIKEPFKNISNIVLAMISFVAGRFGNMMTLEELKVSFCYAIVILLIIVLSFVTIRYALKELVLSDYKLYDQFMYDLRQVKIVGHINKNNEKDD